jgi:hypothetical protein
LTLPSVADTGRDPEPLQRLSTRKVYVVTRRLDAQLDPTPHGDRGARERQLADLVGNVVVTKVNQIAANVFRLDRVDAGC